MKGVNEVLTITFRSKAALTGNNMLSRLGTSEIGRDQRQNSGVPRAGLKYLISTSPFSYFFVIVRSFHPNVVG
jgi:hypothetical protein